MSYKPYKKKFEHSYALGVFPTIELLESDLYRTDKVILHTAGVTNKGVEKIVSLCEQQNIPYMTNDKLIEKLSKKENCYAIGIFRKQQHELVKTNHHVVFVHPSDMGNLGTMLRTALGFGFTEIALIRPAADVYDPKVIRASMGSFFHLNVQYFDDFENYQQSFTHDLYVFRLNGDVSLQRVQISENKPYALVFGNESSGLSSEFDSIGTGIYIPHHQNIDSLNLSVAFGIAAYHFTQHTFS